MSPLIGSTNSSPPGTKNQCAEPGLAVFRLRGVLMSAYVPDTVAQDVVGFDEEQTVVCRQNA